MLEQLMGVREHVPNFYQVDLGPGWNCCHINNVEVV